MMQDQQSNTHGRRWSDTTLGIYVFVLLVFWTIVFLYTVHPVLPANPIQLPLEDQNPLVKLLPQGWGFFTRDPRTMDMTALVRTSGGSWQLPPGSNKSWPRPLEFSRRRKIVGVEVGLILDEITEPQWQECKELPTVCLESAQSNGQVSNVLHRPSLCGDVGIIRQPPIPWAWSQAPDETVMPSQVLRVLVSCHD
jgi:antimicrobial peptide system SdpA family protein